MIDRTTIAPTGLEPTPPTVGAPPVSHPTATARDGDGLPLDRSVFATGLLARLAAERLAAGNDEREPSRVARLSSVEVQVVAELLDELSGVYAGEELGQLAGSLSAQLWQRVDA